MTLIRAGLLAASLAAATAAHAQTTSTASASDDSNLTWKGITLYGIVDVDFQYENHGAPFSNYFISGGSDIVQKNSNNQVSGLTSNGLSQSRVGLQGNEPLPFLDFSGVFKLETFFNPASGQITDALKSVTQNNGRPLTEQSTNIDSSVAGQPFQQALVGVSSPTYGTITFGRQNTTLADLIAKYDPQQTSYAFSLLGLSGTPAGGGDTQDRRLDASIKYDAHFFDIVHFGAQYKTQGSSAASYAYAGTGEAFSAFEVALGAQYLGASIDGFYTKIRDAVSAGTLSAAQVGDLASLHLSSQNSVAGTISDNASYGAMVSYSLGSLVPALPLSLYGGYQHITYMDPSIKLLVGFDDIGGYVLGAVNNTAYEKADKILQVYWGGVRYAIIPQLTATVAYYGEKQDAYATGKTAGCSTSKSGSCAGNFDAVSASLVYHLSKRFDAYAGVMYSSVSGGLGSGYLNDSMIDPTIGVRFTF